MFVMQIMWLERGSMFKTYSPRYYAACIAFKEDRVLDEKHVFEKPPDMIKVPGDGWFREVFSIAVSKRYMEDKSKVILILFELGILC